MRQPHQRREGGLDGADVDPGDAEQEQQERDHALHGWAGPRSISPAGRPAAAAAAAARPAPCRPSRARDHSRGGAAGHEAPEPAILSLGRCPSRPGLPGRVSRAIPDRPRCRAGPGRRPRPETTARPWRCRCRARSRLSAPDPRGRWRATTVTVPARRPRRDAGQPGARAPAPGRAGRPASQTVTTSRGRAGSAVGSHALAMRGVSRRGAAGPRRRP